MMYKNLLIVCVEVELAEVILDSTRFSSYPSSSKAGVWVLFRSKYCL